MSRHVYHPCNYYAIMEGEEHLAKSQRTRRRRSFASHRDVPQSVPVRVPASLPLSVEDTASVPSLLPKCPRCGTSILNPVRRNCSVCDLHLPLDLRQPEKAHLAPKLALEDDSIQREKAVKIVVMRQAGVTDEEIATVLGLKPISLSGYVYKAGKNGWLDDLLHSPREQMEYQVFHKVVQRIDEALDSEQVLATGMKERTAVALKVGEGTLWNKPQDLSQVAPSSTIVGIKVEVVGGEKPEMRPGTLMGSSSYTDAEVVKEGE